MGTDVLAPVRAVLVNPPSTGSGSALAPSSDQNGTDVARFGHLKGARAFLEALGGSAMGVVRYAAAQAGIAYSTAYLHRRTDEDFRRAWDAAVEQSTDALVREAVRRATVGTVHTWTDKHGIEHSERKVSDLLLMFLIKARRPQEYRDNATIKHEFEGPRMLVGPRPAPALPPPSG